uniref:Uncharacterized protein n=1 Tax=Candidatus Enterococcus clewellii TaxID=1834193 RepID=A0A242KAZ0_9ENTE|nr:hypothetical protein [Enterococcus sp. 9E7_DIV0242]OTP18333.1 hypothetical protein A5888_000147 [Enterococcus sp. 9E7_DIV0242]
MLANNSLIKNILIIVLVLIVGGWALGIVGSLLWFAVRLLQRQMCISYRFSIDRRWLGTWNRWKSVMVRCSSIDSSSNHLCDCSMDFRS